MYIVYLPCEDEIFKTWIFCYL